MTKLLSLSFLFLLNIYSIFSQNTYPNGQVKVKGNKTNGEWLEYYENGQTLRKENYVNGVLEGDCFYYHENGKIKEKVKYINGSPEGDLAIYYKNGELASKGKYINGKKEGELLTYHDNGQLNTKGKYVYGKKEGEWVSNYESGRIKDRITYINGLKNGEYFGYHENGKIWRKNKYISGKQDGDWVEYYDNGQLKVNGKYINGVADGEWLYYNENGQIETTLKYINGELQKPLTKADKNNNFTSDYDFGINTMTYSYNGNSQSDEFYVKKQILMSSLSYLSVNFLDHVDITQKELKKKELTRMCELFYKKFPILKQEVLDMYFSSEQQKKYNYSTVPEIYAVLAEVFCIDNNSFNKSVWSKLPIKIDGVQLNNSALKTNSTNLQTNTNDNIILYGYNVGKWNYNDNSKSIVCLVCKKQCAVKKSNEQIEKEKLKKIKEIETGHDIPKNIFEARMKHFKTSAQYDGISPEEYVFKNHIKDNPSHNKLDLFDAAYNYWNLSYSLFFIGHFCSETHLNTAAKIYDAEAKKNMENARSSSNSSISSNSQSSTTQASTCYACNGSGVCPNCSKAVKKPYSKDGCSTNERNEIKTGYILCNTCNGWGYSRTNVNCPCNGWCYDKDCYLSCMDGWLFCKECNYNGNGSNLGKCNACKGTGKKQ